MSLLCCNQLKRINTPDTQQLIWYVQTKPKKLQGCFCKENNTTCPHRNHLGQFCTMSTRFRSLVSPFTSCGVSLLVLDKLLGIFMVYLAHQKKAERSGLDHMTSIFLILMDPKASRSNCVSLDYDNYFHHEHLNKLIIPTLGLDLEKRTFM